jgi:dipeptidyl-peptidase-4
MPHSLKHAGTALSSGGNRIDSSRHRCSRRRCCIRACHQFCTTQARAAEDAQKPLTVDAIFGHGPLIGTPPEGLTWSPDSKHLTYMDGGELMELDLATGKGKVLVSRAKLGAISGSEGSEIDRDHRSRYKMAAYLWSQMKRICCSTRTAACGTTICTTGRACRLALPGRPAATIQSFHPMGNPSPTCRDHGLSVVRLERRGDGAHRGGGAAPNKTTLNGEVDWVYLEELEVRQQLLLVA